MIFRPQRGSLKESIIECVILPPTKTALAYHLGEPVEGIGCSLYYEDDHRTYWPKTYVITVRGDAVGFTNMEAI